MPESSSADPFTSTLTASELSMASDAGWVPVSLVHGDCSYDPGVQQTSWRDNLALDHISRGLRRGTLLAIDRMRQQAAALGADGVVGVQLVITELTLADAKDHLTRHVSASGTAVVRHDGRAAAGPPFTSLLSGQETWALTQAGCRPLGVVVGFGASHVRTTFQRPDRCAEMPDLTAATYAARKTAMDAMRAQAVSLRATGILAADIRLDHRAGQTIAFSATGTAIRTPSSGVQAPPTTFVISLNDPRSDRFRSA